MINCLGCHADGVKTVYCESLCPIRQCAISKGYRHCGRCSDMDSCEKLSQVTSNNAQARRNLEQSD